MRMPVKLWGQCQCHVVSCHVMSRVDRQSRALAKQVNNSTVDRLHRIGVGDDGQKLVSSTGTTTIPFQNGMDIGR